MLLRRSLPTDLAFSSCPMPESRTPRPCTSGTASSAATSATTSICTSTRSARRRDRWSPERCLPATDVTAVTTACPARRRSRGKLTPCCRENTSTLSSADWRRKCKRKSRSCLKKTPLRKSVTFLSAQKFFHQAHENTPQTTTPPSKCASGRVNAFSYSGRGRGGGGRGGGRGGGNTDASHAVWHSKPMKRQDWINFRNIPWASVLSAQKKSTRATTAESHQTDKNRTSSLRTLVWSLIKAKEDTEDAAEHKEAIEEEAEEEQDSQVIDYGNDRNDNSQLTLKCI